MSDSTQIVHDGIAVIGMAGRFPGAANVNEFWGNLKDGVESITFFSDEELSAAGVSSTLLDNPDYVKAGAILQDIELFDASFFGFTPREAEITDPQHRLFLECSWEALESSGYDPDTYHGLIGLYAGQSSNGYFYNLDANPEIIESLGSLQVIIGNDKDHLATSVSYRLNLRGPSLTVQTSCSTSLVAVHLACQSLLNYGCDMAIAGGVSIKVPHKKGYLYQKGSINSPDGHCRAFDAAAQGVIAGNGVGVVILKRLEDALAEGDAIHAVIKGTAINNDGSAKVGYTAPGLDGQAEVIAMAQAAAEVEPDSITYVEAHGTGTALGDPIEVAALTQVWRASTGGDARCAIGSVKTNIGHLDAAAGAAGLIKTVLSLRHAMIPPSLHFQHPNPDIDFANGPFFVNAQLRPWVTNDGQPRRAGVSSFGMGGTNAHVVIEQAPDIEPPRDVRPLHLITLSAKSDTALEKMSTNLAQHLELNPALNLHDVAYTLQAGRKAFKHRRAFVCRDAADAVNILRTADQRRLSTRLAGHQNRPVVFMFAGQGSQRINMARELYEVERVFSGQVDICAELLIPQLGFDLRDVLYPTEAKAAEATQQINQTSLAQPTLFVIEYALAKLWMSWGVNPHAMFGHSIGEYVAACLADVLTLEEALKIVAFRSQVVQQLPVGSMLAVALPEEELKPLLGTDLSIAAINGPREFVVSGQTELVNELETRLSEQGVATSRLRTSHAFHSAMMSPILETFRVEMQKIDLQPPMIPYLSNVTGTWITAGEATDPSYWVSHLRQTVRFYDAVKELAQKPDWVLLELGPAQTLTNIVKQHRGASEQVVLSTLPQSGSSWGEYEHLLRSSGELWLSSVSIDWTRMYDGWRKQRVPLPTYPFERKKHWLALTNSAAPGSSFTANEKKTDIADWFYVPSWQRSVAMAPLSLDELRKHKSTWLLFADTTNLTARLRARLEEGGQEVVIVVEGEQFGPVGPRTYTLNPGERSHYVELIKDLRERELFPQQVFHLWGITQPGATADLCAASFEQSQATGFYSLLFLAQTIGSRKVPEPIHIAVVTNELQEVTGDEVLNPMKATSLGACRVLAQEYPNLDSRSIDIVLPPIGTSQEARLIDALIEESRTRPTGRTVAYRGAHRWVQSFSAARLEPPVNESVRLRDGGVYLITNGLSELGLAIAEYLFSACRARLIFTTPTVFPTRDQWNNWLAGYDEQDETRRAFEQLIELEKSGAEIAIFNATTAGFAEFQRAVEMEIERFSGINGLIHAEDSLSGGLIELKTSAMTDAVLAPKVEGVLALDALFSKAPLDFIVLFSSVIGSTGGTGLVEYCAANAFLDAFARYKTLNSDTPAVAIDWDILHWDTRPESLAPDIPQVRTQIRTLRDKFGIRLEDALEAFTRVIASNHSQVVASMRDFATIFAQQDAAKSTGLMEQLGELRLAERESQHLKGEVEHEAPRNDTERQMVEIWQRIFGIERLGINESFFDIGGNSLLGIQLISHIRDGFGLDIPINSLFDSPTIAGLSNLIIETQLQEQFGDLDKLLDSIEGLSPQEVSERLHKELEAGVPEVANE